MIRLPPRSPLSPPRRFSYLRTGREGAGRTAQRSACAAGRGVPRPPEPKRKPMNNLQRVALLCAVVFALTAAAVAQRSEEHTSELQSRQYLVCRLLLEKKKNT